MYPQITINVGSVGSAAGYSGGSGAMDQGALPSPVMGMGEAAMSQEGAVFGLADLPTPMMQGASGDMQDAGGLPTPMMQGASGDMQDAGGLPTPMMQGASGDMQDAGGLPTPMMQGASGDMQDAGGLPTPMMQGASGDMQDAGGLPTPMMQGASGDVQAEAGLPRPSEKGHLGEHDQVSASSGSGGDLPIPLELQELMGLIQAEEAKTALPEPAEDSGPVGKRAKK